MWPFITAPASSAGAREFLRRDTGVTLEAIEVRAASDQVSAPVSAVPFHSVHPRGAFALVEACHESARDVVDHDHRARALAQRIADRRVRVERVREVLADGR